MLYIFDLFIVFSGLMGALIIYIKRKKRQSLLVAKDPLTLWITENFLDQKHEIQNALGRNIHLDRYPDELLTETEKKRVEDAYALMDTAAYLILSERVDKSQILPVWGWIYRYPDWALIDHMSYFYSNTDTWDVEYDHSNKAGYRNAVRSFLQEDRKYPFYSLLHKFTYGYEMPGKGVKKYKAQHWALLVREVKLLKENPKGFDRIPESPF